MTPKEAQKAFTILFFNWVQEETFQSVKGYILYDDGNMEFQIDELYDYWLENVYSKK